MAIPDTAVRHRAAQQQLTAATIAATRSTWGRLTLGALDQSWRTIGPRLLVLVSEAQRSAAMAGASYVDDALAEQDIDVQPAGRVSTGPLVGIASDGRDLDSLLYQPVIETRVRLSRGVAAEEAAEGGLTMLERIVATQIADAGRTAAGIGIAVRPRTGYVRMLVTPSCPRCVVLAGRFYRWNAGFLRHPLCDCRHIPTSESMADDYTVNPRKAVEEGQVRGLSKADTRAILDGADPGQVINAHRGIKPGGITTEGKSRRSIAGRRMRESGVTGPRLRPEAIYRQASSREEAVELLRRYGYVV